MRIFINLDLKPGGLTVFSTRRYFINLLAAGLIVPRPTFLLGQDQAILREGSPVRMRLNRTISSANVTLGENVDFETLDDVTANEAVIIPKGSTAMATITEAVHRRSMGRGGKLNVNIDYVRLPTGEKLPLRGVQDATGGGHAGAMTGAIVATAIVFFPAAPLFLFIHGKDITIPKGHEVTVYTNSDYDPKKAKLTSKARATVATNVTGTPLTNADILKLHEASLNESLAIGKIKASPANYNWETGDLIDLKKAGLPDATIAAMIEASRR